MKKKKLRWIILGGLLLAFCLFLTTCSKSYSGPNKYHMIYDHVKTANKSFTKDSQKETLLAFEEYAYCSYMLLFPREQPEDLGEFEFHWSQGIDYDDYSIYFSYGLEEAVYRAFRDNLEDFAISWQGQTNRPVYTEDTFAYPAYILTWGTDLCEYILLDDENCTVVNVYRMYDDLEEIQKDAAYKILPLSGDYDSVISLMEHTDFDAGPGVESWSVYGFQRDTDGRWMAPPLEELEYDLPW